MNPATSCIDCHMSAGNERELRNVHGQHQLFSGQGLLQAWFLLVNGMFLFISQEMGLGSPLELLGCAAVRELTSSSPLNFSEREYFFLGEYDRRAGLEPVPLGEYIVLPPKRLIALIHPALLTPLLSSFTPQAMMGVHPHMITETEVELLYDQLKGMVEKYPEAVGIGEVGLDLTTKCLHGCYDKEYCRSQKIQGQLRFLRLAFQLAKQLNKVLVLHVRGPWYVNFGG